MNIEWTNDRAELDGFQLRRDTQPDHNADLPWEAEDGHGPVSGWRRANFTGRAPKRPGELELCTDRGAARFYDFAEACRIARKDGWGWLPEPLKLERDEPSKGDGTACGGRATSGPFTAYDPDNFNRAIAEVYRQHRESMTPKAYAAKAALRDYERLRSWANGDWAYCGVIVTAKRQDVELGAASLWGIEDDARDYLDEVSDQLAEEALAEARAKLGELCDCQD